MKTVDITFHLPENSIEAEAALKSMELLNTLNYLSLKVYDCRDYEYDFWNKVHEEVESLLKLKGLSDLIYKI